MFIFINILIFLQCWFFFGVMIYLRAVLARYAEAEVFFNATNGEKL